LQSTPGCHKGAFEVPLGEERLREIDITLIIKTTIFWSGLFGQPHDLVSPLERGLRGVLFFNFADISDFAGLTGKWVAGKKILWMRITKVRRFFLTLERFECYWY
jgi:hypothetical protein